MIRLPIAADPPAQATEQAASEQTGSTPCRILVVDDSDDAATSMSILLELSGHQTRIAHDGVEAVEIARTFLPDVVLLDIGLPRMNGYDTARAIRSEPWGAAMRLIALTGWGQEEDREKSREAGFDDHLVKPVDYVALSAMLQKSG